MSTFTIDQNLNDEISSVAPANGGTVGAKSMRLIMETANLKDRQAAIVLLERAKQVILQAKAWPPA